MTLPTSSAVRRRPSARSSGGRSVGAQDRAGLALEEGGLADDVADLDVADGGELGEAALQLEEGAGEAAHVADEDDLRVVAVRRDERLELGRGERHGLLDEDVLAGGDRRGDERRVQMVGGEDEDGVEVGIGDELGGAGERAGAVAGGDRGGEPGRGVGDGGDSEARVVGEERQVHELGDFAEADEADLEGHRGKPQRDVMNS